MSSIDELRFKYSNKNFEKLRVDFIEKNTKEIKVNMNTYIDGYHLFRELREDTKSLLKLFSLAEKLYYHYLPEEKLKKDHENEIEISHSHGYMYEVNYNIDHFKLCGLAKFYLKEEYEKLIRQNFKDRGIDKIIGSISESQRSKVGFDNKKDHYGSFTALFLEEVLFSKEISIEDIKPYKLQTASLEKLASIYRFNIILSKFDVNHNLKLNEHTTTKLNELVNKKLIKWFFLKYEIEDSFIEQKFSLSKKNLMERNLEPFGANWEKRKELLNKIDFFAIYKNELKKVKNFINENMDYFKKFLDWSMDPNIQLGYLKDAIFVRIDFKYNIFRAKMNKTEFIKKSQYRKKVKLTLEDIELYNNYSDLLERSLKADTKLGIYKWNKINFNEKQVDTKLTINCIKDMNSDEKKNDLFCLVTNDSDFVPVLEEANELDKDIFICSTVEPKTISKELKQLLNSKNLIFPKKYEYNKLLDAIFELFEEDDRYDPQYHYSNMGGSCPRPQREILSLIESEESRDKFIKSIKEKIKEEIKRLETLPKSIQVLSGELEEASKRFLERETNVLDFEN
tara:strand:+ start:227 stop:1924 length:1698 start_codon:yes stop_codon:yes gene_type:complete